MKNISSFFAIAIALGSILSCGKDNSVKNNIEGVWGLTHYEYYEKEEGEIVDKTNEDHNPYAPTGEGDVKLSIINSVGSNYSVTWYTWNKKTASWVVDEKYTWNVKGNKIYSENSKVGYSFRLTADSLTLEYSGERIVPWVDNTKAEVYYKIVFRKMGDLTE